MPASSVIDVMRLQEVITSIIAIMGGIAMACKTVAELWKKVRLEPARASHSFIMPLLVPCALICSPAGPEEKTKRCAHRP
jgi:hypothetical protein